MGDLVRKNKIMDEIDKINESKEYGSISFDEKQIKPQKEKANKPIPVYWTETDKKKVEKAAATMGTTVSGFIKSTVLAKIREMGIE